MFLSRTEGEAVRKSQHSRSVRCELRGEFDERRAEVILLKAQVSGLVLQFDTGRGSVMWFTGKPGKPLRDLRSELYKLIWDPK